MIGAEERTGFLSIGQPVARGVVQRAAARGQLQRTLLIHGPRGAGKGAFVDDLLALLFCTEPDAAARPCNACRGCRDGRAHTHPDLVVGSPEVWRELRGTGESIVATARRWLLDSAGAPVLADHRVVLVEGADRANEQTQNALLKALEEPAPRQMFILVADEAQRLLPTIRSRSQLLRAGPVPREELVAFLVDVERLPADQADSLARIAHGLPGRAIGYARRPELVQWRRTTQAELLTLLERGSADRFGSVRDLLATAVRGLSAAPPEEEPDDAPTATGADQRRAAMLILEAWSSLARDLLVSAAGRPEQAPATHLVGGVEEAARRLDPAQLRAFLTLADRAEEGLRENAAPRLALEVAMLAWPTLGAT